jgi:hypothetical protein
MSSTPSRWPSQGPLSLPPCAASFCRVILCRNRFLTLLYPTPPFISLSLAFERISSELPSSVTPLEFPLAVFVFELTTTTLSLTSYSILRHHPEPYKESCVAPAVREVSPSEHSKLHYNTTRVTVVTHTYPTPLDSGGSPPDRSSRPGEAT